MTSQPGKKTIAIDILPNISQSKGNKTKKLGQLIEYNNRNIFLQTFTEDEAGGLVPDLFLFFKKEAVCSLVSIYFDSLNLVYNQNKLY